MYGDGEIRLIDRMWVDLNGNSWDSKHFNNIQAFELSGTLIDCKNCHNCSNCVSCIRCVECSGLKYSRDCHHCRNCSSCTLCSHCVNCILLQDSDNCYNLKNTSGQNGVTGNNNILKTNNF